MTTKKHISHIWLKASVLGCLWASSEIVIGSFLHNLRVPLCGNILTGIGIIIMVSVGQLWTERGLFWRTGLVCALMKSISPSAIIFGPMIAIFSEALLMEISTFAFRKSILAFLVGGALAMSWNLAQMLFGFIINYGSDIISLYQKLTEFFQKQTGIISSNYWWPIEIILIFYVAGGLFASAIGIYIGRVARKNEEEIELKKAGPENIYKARTQDVSGNFSVWMLLLNIILIIAALTVFNIKNLPITAAVVVVIAAFWIIKYPKVMRPLKKPGFWIFLVVTTVLSAYLFTSLSSGKSNGWIIGAEMNLRAVVMILGFAVIGRELRNPVISKWLNGTGFKQLPVALELAFDALPAVISNMPGWKEIRKKPVSSFLSYVHKADLLLKEQESRINPSKQIFILTGERGEGKTTYLKKLVAELKERKVNVTGILSPVVFEEKEKIGYNLQDISNDDRKVFIRINEMPGMMRFRKYFFSKEAIDWGNSILKKSKEDPSDLLIIDEIGFLELEDKGWAESLDMLVSLSGPAMLWVVRSELLEEVIKKWNLEKPMIMDISKFQFADAKAMILSSIS
jgi:nucleoside-triphosphatase THEP1